MNKLKSPLIIVANGDFPVHQIPLEILKSAKSILACDGAANTLIDKGFIPDIIIGDLDSISDNIKTEYKKWFSDKVNIFLFYKRIYFNKKEDYQFKIGCGYKL